MGRTKPTEHIFNPAGVAVTTLQSLRTRSKLSSVKTMA